MAELGISAQVQVEQSGGKVREARLRRFGHMQSRDNGYGMNRGRPERSLMDVMKEDIQRLGVRKGATRGENITTTNSNIGK